MGSAPISASAGLAHAATASHSGERLLALDMMRGIAAFAVLLRHFPWPGSVPPVLPASYLAVDLFFILSGFVIARTYEARLLDGRMRAGEFLRVRVIRLYPLYLLALGLALAVYALSLRAEPIVPLSGSQLAAAALFGLFFLPTPEALSGTANLFPVNFPAWSLFFELAVNLVYVVVLRALGPRLLIVLIAAPFALLWIVASMTGVIDGGSMWLTSWIGGLRCLFGFFTGVALFRLSERYRAPQVSMWTPCLLLLAVLAIEPAFGTATLLAGVGLVFPLAVWLGAAARGGPRIDVAAHWLGYLSYPVYVLQVPVMMLLSGAVLSATGTELARSQAWGVPLYLVLTALVGLAAARWFDDPVRMALRRRRRAVPSA